MMIYTKYSGSKTKTLMNTIWISILIFFVAASVLYLRFTWTDAQESASKQALQAVNAVVAANSFDALTLLENTENDLTKPEYKTIKNNLSSLADFDQDIRFAYLYCKKGDKIIFICDSESADSADCSPPGQELSEADELVKMPFTTGKAVLTPPTTDRWGTWVSALSPIKDKATGDVIAVLGVDYPASTWRHNIWSRMFVALLLVFIVFLLIVSIKILLGKYVFKGAHAEIMATKERFAKTFNNKMVLMAIVDMKDGCYVDVNDHFLDILGFDRNEVIGSKCNELGLFADDQKMKELHKMIADHGFVSNVELSVKKKDGFEITVLFGAESIKDDDKQLWLHTMLDITERKAMEVSLLKAKNEAEKANLSKSQFFANMSHEIRTPLNGVFGFLQLLERIVTDKKQLDFIHNIKTSTDILMVVINDILDLSKMEANKMEFESITFDLYSTVETTILSLLPKAREKGLEIQMIQKTDVPRYVMGDPTRLRQVIMNLLNNAIKFTNKGEITVEFGLKNENDGVCEIFFNIIDEGIGMSQEMMKNLFKPFLQADASSTRKYGGTGLGLTISKNIVEFMGGKISVTSEPDKGSTFSFTICLPRTINELGRNTAIEYEILRDKRILIVDDNIIHCDIAKLYLQEKHCVVDGADSVDAAMKKISAADSKELYDLILVDYQMPYKSGYSLMIELKDKSLAHKIPLILCTSPGVKGDAKEAKTRGFAGYLTKPYEREELLTCITMVLSQKKEKNTGESIFVTRHLAQEVNLYKKLKILLVEDNEINRRFFIQFLKIKELVCDVAVDGAEAVQACIKKEYDFIFMDCQMPVMDGYDATREIRKMEEKEKRKPAAIIALTANAMKGDLEKCLAAGMNDFLSKPVKIDQVMDMLGKY